MAHFRRKRLYNGLMLALFVLPYVAGFGIAERRNAGGFLDGLHNIFAFPSEVVSEAVEKVANLPGHLVAFFPALLETLNIAAVSTVLGALLGTILSLHSTRGLARFPRLNPVFRRLMDLMRAFPEIVVALVPIFVLGSGPVPAMIPIALDTAGATGKLYSEVNENADLKPIQGLTSVGATWMQQMWFGVIPQVAPNYLSYALLRFEVNIRASAILGFVGAGYELRNAMSWGKGRFDEAAAIFILLFLTIVVVEHLSSVVRDWLARGRRA